MWPASSRAATSRSSAFVLLLALSASILASGCEMGLYFLRPAQVPMQGLAVRMDPYERRECLVLFVPGMLDTPDTFLVRGVFSDVYQATHRCDLVALDANFTYYRNNALVERVSEDILRVAEGRGYREVWIVGVSMGGIGSLMVTEANPGLVRGVVLLAPFLGDPALLTRIEEAGGLAEWEAPADADPSDPREYEAALWAWLQGYASEPDTMPQLFIGTGTNDERPGVRLLEEVLPEGNVGHVPGGHDWNTWRTLLRRLLESPPWDPRAAAPSFGELATREE